MSKGTGIYEYIEITQEELKAMGLLNKPHISTKSGEKLSSKTKDIAGLIPFSPQEIKMFGLNDSSKTKKNVNLSVKSVSKNCKKNIPLPKANISRRLFLIDEPPGKRKTEFRKSTFPTLLKTGVGAKKDDSKESLATNSGIQRLALPHGIRRFSGKKSHLTSRKSLFGNIEDINISGLLPQEPSSSPFIKPTSKKISKPNEKQKSPQNVSSDNQEILTLKSSVHNIEEKLEIILNNQNRLLTMLENLRFEKENTKISNKENISHLSIIDNNVSSNEEKGANMFQDLKKHFVLPTPKIKEHIKNTPERESQE